MLHRTNFESYGQIRFKLVNKQLLNQSVFVSLLSLSAASGVRS